MDFIFKGMDDFEAANALIEKLIIPDASFPEYIFKEDWQFVPVVADTTGANIGNFHNWLCRFLEYKQEDYYYIVPFDSDTSYINKLPIVILNKFDEQSQFEKVWSRTYQNEGNGMLDYYIDDGYGYYLYVNERMDWLILDVAELGVTFLGSKKNIDISFYKDNIGDYLLVDKLLLQNKLEFNYDEEQIHIFNKNYTHHISL